MKNIIVNGVIYKEYGFQQNRNFFKSENDGRVIFRNPETGLFYDESTGEKLSVQPDKEEALQYGRNVKRMGSFADKVIASRDGVNYFKDVNGNISSEQQEAKDSKEAERKEKTFKKYHNRDEKIRLFEKAIDKTNTKIDAAELAKVLFAKSHMLENE